LRKIIAILLLTSITLQLCNRVGIIAWFSLNQDKVVELFCINKDKPELDCKGKCYLAEKLEEAKQSEEGASIPNSKHKQTTEELLFLEKTLLLSIPGSAHQISFSSYKSSYAHQFMMSVFQPPRA
jgi:hypothetical protein